MTRTFFSLILVLSLAMAFSPAAFAQTDALVVEGNKVGVGITTPVQKLHVYGTDGNTRLLVQEQSSTEAERTLYQVRNNGVTIFQVWDASADGSQWNFEAEGPSFRINKAGSGGEEMIIRNRNDASGFATLTVNGSVAATNVTFTSSRALKTDFSAVDQQQILDRLMALPISEWSFRSEENGRRHIGPVAEEFNQAFDLRGVSGEISLIDANGVALAGIQALYRVVREKDAKIVELEAANDALNERLARLEAVVSALER